MSNGELAGMYSQKLTVSEIGPLGAIVCKPVSELLSTKHGRYDSLRKVLVLQYPSFTSHAVKASDCEAGWKIGPKVRAE